MGLPIASRGRAIGFLIAVLCRDCIFERIVDVAALLPSAETGEMLISLGFLLLMIEFTHTLADYQEKAIS